MAQNRSWLNGVKPTLNPEEFLEEISSQISLADVVTRRTELRHLGQHVRGNCPFCHEQESEGSFHVYDDHCHCFKCGPHGDHVTFLMRTNGIEMETAIRRVASEAGIEVSERLVWALSTSMQRWEISP